MSLVLLCLLGCYVDEKIRDMPMICYYKSNNAVIPLKSYGIPTVDIGTFNHNPLFLF